MLPARRGFDHGGDGDEDDCGDDDLIVYSPGLMIPVHHGILQKIMIV